MTQDIEKLCADLTFRPAKLEDRLELFDALSENIYYGHDYL